MMSTLVLTSRAVTITRGESDERERWIAAYRQTWPMAGRWAAGSAVQHTVETQDRVFRMTEQLLKQGVVTARTLVFETLIAADWAVPRAASDACVVAAGWRAYKRLTDRQSPAPVSLLLSGGAPVDTLCAKLRRRGYEPIVFDGRDPAAFAWAIFEMEQRLEALKHRAPANDGTEPGPFPFGIAVTAEPQKSPSA